MKSHNSFSSSDAFFNADSSSESKIALFKPENACSQIVSAAKLRYRSSKLSQLNQLWNRFLNALSGQSEPTITQKFDRDGNLYFRVYDPVTRKAMSMTSEQEVRAWFDQRYYQ
ncbi:MAG TPA: hypothetical protein V6C57_10410 [Coleofasciculaceae cyanobacterium]